MTMKVSQKVVIKCNDLQTFRFAKFLSPYKSFSEEMLL